MNYLDIVKPTYIENWSPALCRLSFAQIDIPLTLAETRAIGFHIIEFGDNFIPITAEQQAQLEAAYQWSHRSVANLLTGTDIGPKVEMPDITPDQPWVISQHELYKNVKDRVAEALTKFPKGAIIRLGSRSPKDAWSWNRNAKLMAGDDPFKHIINCSERMSDDLSLALKNNYTPHIFVREWMDIPEWAEFRCFLKKGRLAGVSQYHYHQHFKELEKNYELISHWLRYYTNNYVNPACADFESIIFDVAAIINRRESDLGTETSIQFKLIEINPFFEMTDPCLFDWRKGGDFDETFRFLTPDKKTTSIPIYA